MSKVKLYYITDGSSYIQKSGFEYKTTLCSSMGDTFPYKQGLQILRNNLPKRFKNYYLKEYLSNEIIDINKQKKEAEKIIENKHISFDESIIKDITKDAESIIGLFCYSQNELIEKREILNSAQSFYDMAISDVRHIIKEEEPPAHKRTIIFGIHQKFERKRSEVKQAIKYIDVMIQSYTENWTIDRLKEELTNTQYVPYKGRTYIYDEIMELVG